MYGGVRTCWDVRGMSKMDLEILTRTMLFCLWGLLCLMEVTVRHGRLWRL